MPEAPTEPQELAGMSRSVLVLRGCWSVTAPGGGTPVVQCLWNPGPARFPEEGELYTSSRVGFCLCLRHWNVDVASEIWAPLISAASGWGGAEVPNPVPWPNSQPTNMAVGSLALGAWEGWSSLCQGNQICDSLSHTPWSTNIIYFFYCNMGYMLISQIYVYVDMDYSYAEFNHMQRPRQSKTTQPLTSILIIELHVNLGVDNWNSLT